MAASSLATVIGDYLKVQSPSRKGELKQTICGEEI